jgi:hypothetical protein
MTLATRIMRAERELGAGRCERCCGHYVAIAGEHGYLPRFPPACPACGQPAVLVRRYVRVAVERV